MVFQSEGGVEAPPATWEPQAERSNAAAASAAMSGAYWNLLHRRCGIEFLRDAHSVDGGKPEIIGGSPNPDSIGHIRIGFDAREMNFVFGGDTGIAGRRLSGGGNFYAEVGEGQLKLSEVGRRRELSKGGEGVAVESRGLDQLNGGNLSAFAGVVGDVTSDGTFHLLKSGTRILAVAGEQVEGDLRVKNLLANGTEGQQVGGLAFELFDGDLIAFGDRRKQKRDGAQRRKFGERGGDGARDNHAGARRGIRGRELGTAPRRRRFRRADTRTRQEYGG